MPQTVGGLSWPVRSCPLGLPASRNSRIRVPNRARSSVRPRPLRRSCPCQATPRCLGRTDRSRWAICRSEEPRSRPRSNAREAFQSSRIPSEQDPPRCDGPADSHCGFAQEASVPIEKHGMKHPIRASSIARPPADGSDAFAVSPIEVAVVSDALRPEIDASASRSRFAATRSGTRTDSLAAARHAVRIPLRVVAGRPIRNRIHARESTFVQSPAGNRSRT